MPGFVLHKPVSLVCNFKTTASWEWVLKASIYPPACLLLSHPTPCRAQNQCSVNSGSWIGKETEQARNIANCNKKKGRRKEERIARVTKGKYLRGTLVAVITRVFGGLWAYPSIGPRNQPYFYRWGTKIQKADLCRFGWLTSNLYRTHVAQV